MTLRRLTVRAGWVVAALTTMTWGQRTHAQSVPEQRLDTSAHAQVTFSGFQRGKHGDGVVFVHVTERTGIAVKHEGTLVKVRLLGAGIKGRNNLHPLDLSQFDLLLLNFRLAAVDDGVEIQLNLRREAHLDAQWVERPDGAVSLHVAVPKL
jgi:hypothetical protein